MTFSHGWPLSSDNWENKMVFLADQGYRVIAHGTECFPKSADSVSRTGKPY